MTFHLPERLVTVVTLKGGRTKEKEEGKTAYAERCEIAVRAEILRSITGSSDAVRKIIEARQGMRLAFSASTAEAFYLALPEDINAWCKTEYYDLVNWTKVAESFNTLFDICELL